MKKKKKRKVKIKSFVILFLVLGLICGIGFTYCSYVNKNKEDKMYLCSSDITVNFYNEDKEKEVEVVRGSEVITYPNQMLEDKYIKVKYDDKEYYVLNENLTKDKDALVLEKEAYVRTSYNLNKDLESISLLGLVEKGEKLEIVGYDKLLDDGNVNMYKVKTSDNEEGYFYRKYITFSEEESKLNYDEEGLYKVHAGKKDTLGGGDGASLDYYPVEKPKFSNNVMPDEIYALYLNGTKAVISKVDSYIEYAKTTNINAFVVDIKDSGVSAYASKVMQDYSETSYKNAQNSFEDYQKAIKKIKDAGFYVIGRITTFKDTYYITDNKEVAINGGNDKPLFHQSSYWPSAFNRNVWEYNISLAKEAVLEMGFNEIQFDYVRFPDGLRTKEKNKQVDYKNIYNETKAQAIQRFLMYATNELHKLEVYVSCDVFGESSSGYVTAYGQYWPAISNVVDVISAMPYTDHFDRNDSSSWTNPYKTMSNWGKTASDSQKNIKTPAIVRTWITAYNTPYWNPTVTYNGKKLEEQIEGLYKEGLTGGYMTWNSASNLEKYKSQKSAFTREYK